MAEVGFGILKGQQFVNPNQGSLFPQINKARYGEGRQYRSLFLPRLLKKEAAVLAVQEEALARAHKILIRWADLEESGKLNKMSESSLRGDFLNEVFGQALGYTLFSENLDEWHFWQEYRVNGGFADAAIGMFRKDVAGQPAAVIELKGPTANIDRDRTQGRTAVQQCWDYLSNLPQCPWGIVCNYVSFRLYHRDQTPRAYQHFALQDLRKLEAFREFYYLFAIGGVLSTELHRRPRAEVLLEETGERQREVGDELYSTYNEKRYDLIQHLTGATHDIPLESAIRITQKLLDRIIFVAFCEDRDLLPANTIRKACEYTPPFTRVTNPKWQNFRNLFRSIDEGNRPSNISAYNGGLFRVDPEVDDLELGDEWTHFFDQVGRYDFREEVNVDVLGHLFERSVNEVERIKQGGLFGAGGTEETIPRMAKSAERKRHGIYYTPPEFTRFIVYHTIGAVTDNRIAEVARRHGVDVEAAKMADAAENYVQFWTDCLEALKEIKIVDPACGSGAFLIAAYDLMYERYIEVADQIAHHSNHNGKDRSSEIPEMILRNNLHGVDLSRDAVEITQLALWIRSAQPGKTLADLSENIICGNSLVSDRKVDPDALIWEETFRGVFDRENRGFDCVIGNPPWERMKLQEREFFDVVAPEIAGAMNAATRRTLIEELKKSDPELYGKYEAAREKADRMLEYVRSSERFPLTGKGDINTYAVFAELAYQLVSGKGRVGLLVPSGIAADHTTRDFFETLTANQSLVALFDFENKAPVFEDVHRSMKFCILLLGGKAQRTDATDFVFFAHRIDELRDPGRHIRLSAGDIALLNPNTKTCPVFRSRRDADLTKAVYRRVPVLVDLNREEGGNPWGIRFLRMFDQTNDAELFRTAKELKDEGYRRYGAVWKKRKEQYLPLYEAKMVQMYDHRAASVRVDETNWMRQGQTVATHELQHQNPEFVVEPR